MLISKIELTQAAFKTRFRPEILEKVWYLMTLLDTIYKDPFLESRLALKGGTALNLFIFQVPRLSVDIDLNYIGNADREAMLHERPKVDRILEGIFNKEGMTILSSPERHAGGKWRLKYPSALGNYGNLEVDVNYMFRVPLWATTTSNSHAIGNHIASNVRLMNTYEIIAGKITALLARTAARDLFDVHQLTALNELEREKLRLACILYTSTSTVDLRKITLDELTCDTDEIKRLLLPLLKQEKEAIAHWTQETYSLIGTCKKVFLDYLLPLTSNEKEFLDLFHDKGFMAPSLLTHDPLMIEKIHQLPGLKWKLQINKR